MVIGPKSSEVCIKARTTPASLLFKGLVTEHRTVNITRCPIRPCHTAAILSRETKKALFYHAKPRSGNHGGEAWSGKTKLLWSLGTILPPCDKGELQNCPIIH